MDLLVLTGNHKDLALAVLKIMNALNTYISRS